MKVLHSGTLDVNAGGPAMSTYYTLCGLNKLGVKTEIIMYPLSVGGRLRGNQVKVHFSPAPYIPKLAYTHKLKPIIKSLGEYDIYHAQGVWQYPTYAMVDVARYYGKPYIITPRGMLYPQDIAKSNTLFKRLSLNLRLLKDLNKASCVQVTCKDEMMHCRNLGVTSPIAIIPNPIEIQTYNNVKQDHIFRVGYLGRLSPRKNVEGLIYAFNELKDLLNSKAELLIIGGGDSKYESFLQSEVERLKLKNVKFTGFLSGESKDNALASLSVLAMPSEFENLGNVILEALIRQIPCIATKGSPWEELNTQHCGWWIDYNQESITRAIKEAFCSSPQEMSKMGENGRNLMKNKYSVEAVAIMMNDLYCWIMGKKEKPNFVYL